MSHYQAYMQRQGRYQSRTVARGNRQPIMVFTVERDPNQDPSFGDGSNVRECAAIPVHNFRKGSILCVKI